MKKSILITSTVLVLGLYSCSKEEWQHKPSRTFTREGMLCEGPWDFDRVKVTTKLDGEVVEDYSDSVYGILEFKKDHTVRINIPGDAAKTVFWSMRTDTLTMNNLEYRVVALSRNRLELYRDFFEMIPSEGIAYTQTASQMTR